MAGITVDFDMICKYNQPGPRYTSYPPANHFTEDIDRKAVESVIASSDGEKEKISLYFHLPFCQTGCYYCGCTNIVTQDQQKSGEYLKYLRKEVEMLASKLPADREVVQIQLGGGTPNFLLPEEILELGELIHNNFSISPDVEAGVEIDPRRLTKEKVDAYIQVGFNRASLGVQDVDPDVQKAVNRIQPFEMTAQSVTWLRDAGINSINFDLIYGLPVQTIDSFTESIEKVQSLSPDRLAIYSYAHIPWIKPNQQQLEDRLPPLEDKLRLLQLAIETLTDDGMVYIGMDHFATPDDSLTQALRNGTLQRNFQGYSTWKGVGIYGFGMSAISSAKGAYWQNQKKLMPYYNEVNDDTLPFFRGYIMNEDDNIRYQAIMLLMCNFYLDYAEISNALGVDFQDYFKAEIASLSDLEDDGLLVREKDGLRVTELGRLFIRIVAMRFDAYLNPANQGRYSKVV